MLTAALALATVLLAIYTGMMMRATRTVAEKTAALAQETQYLAEQTIAANALADRHHQEAMMPCVVLASGYVGTAPNGLKLYEGAIRNIGPGIALDVRLWIDEIGEQIALGVLPANSNAVALNQERCMIYITDQAKKGRGVKVKLLYRNMFGAEGTTTHHGRIGDREFNTVFSAPPVASGRVGAPA